MVEQRDVGVRIPEAEITKIDLDLLSPVEHEFIGSGVSLDGAKDAPLTPVAIVKQEKNSSEVYQLRQEQHWITSNLADEDLLGFAKAERYTVIFQLPDFDFITGEIVNLPTFYGLYDREERTVIKDKESLTGLGFNADRARFFTEAKIGHFFPKETLNTDPQQF